MLRKSMIVLSGVVAVVAVQWTLGSQARAAEDVDHESGSRSIARESSGESGDSGDSGDEYNFSWLDPDKKVYVLQNRKYRKKGRFALFVSGGLNLSNPYRSEYAVVPRASYWFTEQFGVDFFYSSLSNRDNSTLTALKKASPTALPFVRENRGYYGVGATWTPWYAKLNFFNKILYFDWFFLAGAGQASTAVDQNTRADRTSNFVTEDLFTVFFGTGMQFYVTRSFLVRLDMIGMMYSATGADGTTKSNVQNYDFAAGIGWAF